MKIFCSRLAWVHSMRSKEQEASEIAIKLERMEKNIPEQLKEIWSQIKLLSSLVIDYLTNDYRENITTKIVAQIIGVLLYLVMPMDLIFDGIPLVGFSDDLIVLTKVLDSVLQELEEYKNWRASQ